MTWKDKKARSNSKNSSIRRFQGKKQKRILIEETLFKIKLNQTFKKKKQSMSILKSGNRVTIIENG